VKLAESAYYSEDQQLYHNHFTAMGTRLDMVLHGISMQQGNRTAEALLNETRRLESLMNRYHKDSPVWRINHLAGSKTLRVEDELFELLLLCRVFHERTCGLFDISLGSVVNLVKHGHYDADELNRRLNLSGMDKVILDPEKLTIGLKNELVQIDFGGFGKGYTLDRLRLILISHEILNAFISFGGSSVLALGDHPHGSGWKAGINHQMNTGESIFSFDLHNESLSTSGISSDQELARAGGQIIHPIRGLMEKQYHHISIKSTGAAEAEVLSTSLIAADEIERNEILTRFKSCHAVGIKYDKDGKACIDMLN
jgi:thiamine biosynthesis lipoprotein